ncbi:MULTISPECIES: YncE family protein [unclassified Blastococcus]
MPAVRPGAEVLAAPDGTVHVVGVAEDQLQLITGDRRTPLGPAPDDVTAGLSPDGRTAYLAASTRDREQLLAVDPATSAVTATAEPAGSVGDLAAGADGVTLLLDTETGAALQAYGTDLAPAGRPTDLGPDGDPAGLARADDGTAVATLHDPAASLLRLVTVRDGRAGEPVEVADTEDSGADVAVTPDGRRAFVAQAAYGVDPELLALDLATGKEVGSAVLCVGAGDVGALALDPTTGALAAIGACTQRDGPATTVFVVSGT